MLNKISLFDSKINQLETHDKESRMTISNIQMKVIDVEK